MGVTEVKPREFVQTKDGKEAWERELREMSARRLDFEKPVPEHLKKSAPDTPQWYLAPRLEYSGLRI